MQRPPTLRLPSRREALSRPGGARFGQSPDLRARSDLFHCPVCVLAQSSYSARYRGPHRLGGTTPHTASACRRTMPCYAGVPDRVAALLADAVVLSVLAFVVALGV